MSRARVKDETDAERIARWNREVADYERSHPEIVPGTARHDGDPPRGGPCGGILWMDAARMAKARLGSPVRQTDEQVAVDAEALRRHPNPGGYVCGAA